MSEGCIHTPARCNGGGYDGCACGPFPRTRRKTTKADLASSDNLTHGSSERKDRAIVLLPVWICAALVVLAFLWRTL